MNCPKCRFSLNEGATFCPKCGTSIIYNTPKQPPAPPVQPPQNYNGYNHYNSDNSNNNKNNNALVLIIGILAALLICAAAAVVTFNLWDGDNPFAKATPTPMPTPTASPTPEPTQAPTPTAEVIYVTPEPAREQRVIIQPQLPNYGYGNHTISGASSGAVYVWTDAYSQNYKTTVANGTRIQTSGSVVNGRIYGVTYGGTSGWFTWAYVN